MIVSSHITSQLADQHELDLRGDAATPSATRRRRLRRAPVAAVGLPLGEITIRRDAPDDGRALARLAEVDGQRLPAGPFLLAEVEGEARAALSLAEGRAIADPFRQTAELVSLLSVRARQLDAVAVPRGLKATRRLAVSH